MIRRQLTFDIDPQIHTRLRDEAIRQGVSIAALVTEWLKPFFDKLPPANHELQRQQNAAE